MALGDIFGDLALQINQQNAPVSPFQQRELLQRQQQMAAQQQMAQRDWQAQMLQAQQRQQQLMLEQQQFQSERYDKAFDQKLKISKDFDSAQTPAEIDSAAALWQGHVPPPLLQTLHSGAMSRLRSEGWSQQPSAAGGTQAQPQWIPPQQLIGTSGTPETGIAAIMGRPGQVPTATQLTQPTTMGSGLLKEYMQAQNILMSDQTTPEQKGAARQFMTKQEGGEFKAMAAEVSRFKTPQERIAYLQKNDPSMLDYIQGIREGTTPVTGFSTFANDIRMAVKALYPDTDFTKVAFRQRAWAALGDVNGKFQQNILSLNTAAAHLGDMNDAIDALQASHQPIENWFNMVAKQLTGDPNVTAFSAPQLAVTLEVHRALSGVGITDQERASWSSVLGQRGFGYDQAKQFTKSIAQLLDQRLTVAEQTVSSTLGKNALSTVGVRKPEGQQALDKILGGSSSQDNLPSFATVQDAQAAAQRGEIQPGQRIMVGNQTGTWK